MPAAIPFIVAATTLFGTGLSAYEALSGGPKGPDQNALLQQQQADEAKAKAAERDQKLQMLRRAAPDAQAQTGGSLTDAGFSQLVANIAGLPGDINLAEQLLKPGSPSAPGAPGTSNSAFSITPPGGSMDTSGAPFGAGPQRGESGVAGAHIENMHQAMEYLLNGGQISEHVHG